jgi:hypothetical protein
MALVTNSILRKETLPEFLVGVIISETALILNSQNRMSVLANDRSTEGEII